MIENDFLSWKLTVFVQDFFMIKYEDVSFFINL